MNQLRINNLVMLQFSVLKQDCNISHFITTRQGGVGRATYAGFNAGAYCGDSPEAVETNRMLLCDSMDIAPGDLFVPFQTHDDIILSLTESFVSLLPDEQQKLLNGVDALVTNVPGICIGVTTADCVPILLYDPEKKVVAAVHAGWRGTVKQILSKTVSFMVAEYQSDPASILAGIGPSIGLRSFEVGEEVVEEFLAAGLPVEQFGCRNEHTGKMHLDLCKANSIQLQDMGVPVCQIEMAGLCTFSEDELFFSARRLGIQSGRMLSAIQIRKNF
jgi:YfiH family protein